MIEAYKLTPVLKNYPLEIESIFAYEDYLLIGTKQGNLVIYKLTLLPGNDKFDIQLLRSNKTFAKKAITQIHALPDFQLLITLSDCIHVHDLNSHKSPLITSLTTTKGATAFSVNVTEVKTLTNEITKTLRLCAVVKRKIMLFYWKKNEFLPLPEDLRLPDTPRAIAWCKESICVGYQTEYSLLKVNGTQKELFPTSKNSEPIVSLLDGNRFLLAREHQTYFFDDEGCPLLKYSIAWSDSPISVIDDEPYLIALLPSSLVEVCSIEPKLFLQQINDLSTLSSTTTTFSSSLLPSNLMSLKFLVKCHSRNGRSYVASTKDVYCLLATSVQHQLDELLEQNEFEFALKLANNSPQLSENKSKIINQIQYLQAFNYFCKKDFTKSMKLFTDIETDPMLVIGLYADLLPSEARSRLEYPYKPPELKGADLENGIFALIEYLREVRNSLSYREKPKTVETANKPPRPLPYSNLPQTKKDQLLETVETTMVKCYLLTNDAIVSSLLRLPDNRCHLGETERALKARGKYSELIILYHSKGLHRKALDLLIKQNRKSIESSKLKSNNAQQSYFDQNNERLIQYLQHLGTENLDLILEYSKPLLMETPEDGLKVFTIDTPEVEQLPRDCILDHLKRTNPSIIIPYLEHIINNWSENGRQFHDELALKYIERIRVQYADYLISLPEGQYPAKAGTEPGELGVLRKKLITFLKRSKNYTTETLSFLLMNDLLWDERAAVMGKIGNHKEALTIYVYIIDDTEKAENYCHEMYDKNEPGKRDVYLTLFNLYVSPPSLSDKYNSVSPSTSFSSSSAIVTTSKSFASLTISNENQSSNNNNKRNNNNCNNNNLESKIDNMNAINSRPLEKNLESAFKLLKKHSIKIDALRALLMIPSNTALVNVKDYLETVIKYQLKDRHDGQIFRNLLLAQHHRVQYQRVLLHQKHKILVKDQSCCSHCHKKIGKSAFVRYPNKDLVHYSCRDK